MGVMRITSHVHTANTASAATWCSLGEAAERSRPVDDMSAAFEGSRMKRREFMAVLGAVVAWPMTLQAQQRKPASIGVLALGDPDPAPFVAGFRAGLQALGYVEGRDVRIDVRTAGGSEAELAALAAALVTRKPDVIVAFQTPAATAAKRATAVIPIVIQAGDPVGTGLVASLARPGGNITGVDGGTAVLGAKNLELIRELLPAARRVAVLANAPDPFSKPFVAHIEDAAQDEKIELKVAMLRSDGEIDGALAEVEQWRAGAVIVQPSLPHGRTARLALKHRLPAVAPSIAFAKAGGLLSYSADLPALYRRPAVFVDKILKGRKPADLPVEQPTEYRLIVNLKTAKALGLTVPQTLLVRADEVIE
jgi:ABC-type uncharacterized transport system substrate-binding protein